MSVHLAHLWGKTDDGDEVGDGHEAVEGVGQLPDEVGGEDAAAEDAAADDQAEGQDAVFAKEVAHVHLAEHVPAHDGGEGEKEEGDGQEGDAAGAEGAVEGLLRDGYGLEVGALISAGEHDNEGRGATDQDRVDKDAGHGHEALNGGVLDVRHGVGMRRGAHTGLVGEEAARYAVADGVFHHRTGCTARRGFRGEGLADDALEHVGHVADIKEEHDERAEDVDQRHEGDNELGDGCDALLSAHDDHAHEQRQHDADEVGQVGHGVRPGAEGVDDGDRDGVGLHHITHATEGEDDGQGEEDGQWVAFEAFGDVVCGPTGDAAILHLAVLLRQRGFGEYRSHAQQRGHPHPEDGAHTTGGDGRSYAANVARAHLCGHGCGQGLEGVDLVGLVLLSVLVALLASLEGWPEGVLKHESEVSDLWESEVDGVEDADGQEDVHQEIVPEEPVELLYVV